MKAGDITILFISLLLFLLKVWDRRQLNESCPYPVGILAGHSDGITHIDPRVIKKLTFLAIDKKCSKIYLSQRCVWFKERDKINFGSIFGTSSSVQRKSCPIAWG